MSPLELANVLQLTGSYRESSWNGEFYVRDWHNCAVQALAELNQPPEFAPPISIMLYPEYADTWEWVEQVINKGYPIR